MKDVPYLLIPTKYGTVPMPVSDSAGPLKGYDAWSHVKIPFVPRHLDYERLGVPDTVPVV